MRTIFTLTSRLPEGIAASLLLSASIASQGAQPTEAATPTDLELPAVVVKGNYDNAVGTSDAASEGRVTAKLIQNRPVLRPAELLEFVPGVIVSQHSGDGKANQYYLRGFNLDHGTDFATWVDGMPVNMPTHAHGQGYTDLNFLIPELVHSIHYRKGLYAAEDGDFSSAGSARIRLVDALDKGLASVTVGENSYARALVANSAALRTGTLLYALDAAHNDGPWVNPQHHRRFNGLLRYTMSEGGSRHSLTAMAYTARWNSTDQVPQRAIQSGLIDRFGAIDPSDRGETRRTSLSWNWRKMQSDGEWQANAYAIQSHLDLFSNFTYFLDDEVNGDQFEQAERRQVFGGSVSRLWQTQWNGQDVLNTMGMQWRHDRLTPVGLYTAIGGQRSGVIQESQVRESSVGLYAQNDMRWAPWLRSIAGLRVDRFGVTVNSSIAANSGKRHAWISSPKLSLVLGPWAQTEFFINAGHGFHSNDARGMTATVTAKDLSPVDSAVPLVRSRGSELGVRTEWLPGLQSSLSLWQLNLDSELVFVGDAGETEATGASRRHGIEFNNHYVARPWLMFDADVAISQARFKEDQGDAPQVGRHVPGSVQRVVALGATVTDWGPWFGQLQVRYFGPRALIEDNSVRSKGTTLTYARVGYKVNPDVKLSVDVFNLFNRKVSDIDYYYASRLPGEGADGFTDIHSHPAEPRTIRLTLSASF